MKAIVLMLVCVLFSTALWAQGEIDEQREVYIDNEQTMAFTAKTNGFACDYRYGKYINGYKKRIFEADLSVLKHQKEYKQMIAYSFQSRIAHGKMNFVFSLKGGTGKIVERYSKQDKGSVSISTYQVFGPAIAFIKPIYYDLSDVNNFRYIAKIGDNNFSYNNIQGRASFLKGFNEISFSPGIYFKYGFNFDYSQRTELKRALEAGVMFEGYLLDIPIMDMAFNPRIFGVIYFSYRFGSVNNY